MFVPNADFADVCSRPTGTLNMFELIKRYVQQVRRTFYKHDDPPETPFVCMIRIMCYIGLWPVPEHVKRMSAYHPFVSRAYRIYNRCIYAVIMISVTICLDLFRAETQSNAVLIAEDLTMSCGALIVLFKTFCWHRHHEDLVRLFVQLERRYRDLCISSPGWRMRRVRRFYYLQDFTILVTSAVLIIALIAAFTLQPLLRSDKNLMYRAVLPWDTTSDNGYRAACLLQFVQTMPVLLSILCMECCGVLVVNQVTMHLHMLRIKWEHLGAERSGALRNKRTFQQCMERRVHELVAAHQTIIRIVDDIHDIFQPMYQVQVCASTCTICTSAVCILVTIDDDIMYALRFLCFILAAFFQLLFWCWAGERTFDMSVQINRAAYTSNWVDMDVRLQRKVSLVLMRSQRPLEFTSDPFYVLNYETFSAILGASCSYFTMLRTLLEL